LTHSQTCHLVKLIGQKYTCHSSLGHLVKMYKSISKKIVSQLEPFEKLKIKTMIWNVNRWIQDEKIVAWIFKYVRMWAINKPSTIENEGCKC